MIGPAGQKVMLLSIPEFCKVPSLLLLNLKNFEVERVTFDGALKSGHNTTKLSLANGQ